jgi:hypothetical protein
MALLKEYLVINLAVIEISPETEHIRIRRIGDGLQVS